MNKQGYWRTVGPVERSVGWTWWKIPLAPLIGWAMLCNRIGELITGRPQMTAEVWEEEE